jgi:hypothetical protein
MTSSSSAANATIRVQLELLSEISLVLPRARISFWLRGGWALDFLLGQITRVHADIDLVAWRRHAGRIHSLLTSVGYDIVPGPPPEIQTRSRRETWCKTVVRLRGHYAFCSSSSACTTSSWLGSVSLCIDS